MKIRTALSLACACGLLAVNSGCRSFRATAHGKFQSAPTHLAVFDITVTQVSPPKGSTTQNIEVRAGPTSSPTNLIGSVTSHDLSEWSGSFNDPSYAGESTYYVQVVVIYLPGLQTEMALFKFSSILGGLWLTGVEMTGAY